MPHVVFTKESGFHLQGQILGVPGVPLVAFSGWYFSALTLVSEIKDSFGPATAERIRTPWGFVYLWTAGAAQGVAYAFGLAADALPQALQDRKFLRRARAAARSESQRGLALIPNPAVLLPQAESKGT